MLKDLVQVYKPIQIPIGMTGLGRHQKFRCNPSSSKRVESRLR